MALPVAIAGVVGAVAGVGGAIVTIINSLSQNPLVAYACVLAFFILDGGLSVYLNWQGVFGSIASFVLSSLGVPIIVYSWQLLILVASLPVISYAVNH